MLKVGILGCGGISGVHVPGWKNYDGAEIVAYCDIRPEQMEKYGYKTDSEALYYTDYKEMVENEKLDVIDICLPTFLHVEHAVDAMKRGINVICEKPLTLNKSDIDLCYNTAKENNVKFMVAQCVRFWNEYVYLKEIYDTKKYGNLLSASMVRISGFPHTAWNDWMADTSKSGGVAYDMHIHDVDYMVYLLGAPKDMLCKRIKTEENDQTAAIFDYGNFYVNVICGWCNAPYRFRSEFRFVFDNAVVAYENDELTIYTNEGELRPFSVQTRDEGTVHSLPKTDAYGDEIRYFADCIRNKKPVEILKPEELKETLSLIEKYSH